MVPDHLCHLCECLCECNWVNVSLGIEGVPKRYTSHTDCRTNTFPAFIQIQNQFHPEIEGALNPSVNGIDKKKTKWEAMIGIGGDDDKTALKGGKDQMTSYQIKRRRKK